MGSNHNYLSASASWNAPLWRVKPCSSIGRVVSQLDAPFSDARAIALFRELGRDALRVEAWSSIF